MSKETAVSLENVTFRYFEKGKRNVLDDVSLSVAEGTITVLMGASGCGKSTLAAVTAGLYPENGGFLAGGTIRLFGRDVSSLAPAQRAAYLGFLFQNPDLQFCMNTLRSELIFCLENIGTPAPGIDSKIEETAVALPVRAMLDRPLTTLSGGEKQMAMLACVYALGSRILILDEAFANIDRENAEELLALLVRLRAEGRTILAIDHRIDLWKDAADEFIVLGDGAKVLARGINAGNLNDYRDLFEREGLFEVRQRHRKAGQPKTASSDVHPDGAENGRGSADVSPILRLENVSISRTADNTRMLLSGADASFEKGTITAILGKSGIGKTTAFLSILKQHPYSGNIFLAGKELRKIRKKELYREIGIVFQNPANQFITQNVFDEVTAGIRIWEPKLSEESVKKRAVELLGRYGLSEKVRYSPYMLSQGQQRRLAVLSVLCGGQKILLLDEPTYGQDYRSTAAIMEHLTEKVREEGLTVIFITHDRTLAGVFADRVYELKDRTFTEIDPETLLGVPSQTALSREAPGTEKQSGPCETSPENGGAL